MKSPPFQLHITAEAGRRFLPYLRKHLAKAHPLSASHVQELSLALVGDKRMSDLHQEFMQIPAPTDVLTFPLDADRRGNIISGEVVVCVPEARRQARSRGTTTQQELLLYALHGLLHLSGFDDRTDDDFRQMHAKEDQILNRLGIGNVFAAGATRVPSPLRRRAKETK